LAVFDKPEHTMQMPDQLCTLSDYDVMILYERKTTTTLHLLRQLQSSAAAAED